MYNKRKDPHKISVSQHSMFCVSPYINTPGHVFTKHSIMLHIVKIKK